VLVTDDHINSLKQWFQKCALRIRRELRPVARETVDTFM